MDKKPTNQKRQLVGRVFNPPATITKPLDHKRWLPNAMTRSGVFFPVGSRGLRLMEPLPPRQIWGASVVVDNRLLGPYHMRVIMAALEYGRAYNNTAIRTTKYRLCMDAIGRHDGRAYKLVDALLDDIVATALRIRYTQTVDGEPHEMLLRGPVMVTQTDETTGEIGIILNGFFARVLLAGGYTRLTNDMFKKFTTTTAPLLYAFYGSHRAVYGPPYKYAIPEDKLWAAIGMDIVAARRGWGRKYVRRLLRRGHNELIKCGFLEHWRFAGGVYHVEAPVPVPTKLMDRTPEPPAASPVADHIAGRWQWAQGPNPARAFKIAARYAEEFFKQYRRWFVDDPRRRVNVYAVADWAVACLEAGRNVPQHAGFIAQHKFWTEELPAWLLHAGHIVEPVRRGPPPPGQRY